MEPSARPSNEPADTAATGTAAGAATLLLPVLATTCVGCSAALPLGSHDGSMGRSQWVFLLLSCRHGKPYELCFKITAFQLPTQP